MPSPSPPAFQSPVSVYQCVNPPGSQKSRASFDVAHKGQPPGARIGEKNGSEAKRKSPIVWFKDILEPRNTLFWKKR